MKNSTVNRSTGDHSTGDRSTGDYSTGDRSTGDYSTGYWSTGCRSTGYHSTGDRSTGGRSNGDYSTGDWSISDYSTGHFSTIDYSGFGAFNKPCTPQEWEESIKPDWIYWSLTQWVNEEKMTSEEKKENPAYKTTGGYLKVYEYKEAWRKAWNEARLEDKKKTLKMLNFDNEVFKEISGIDVEKELGKCNCCLKKKIYNYCPNCGEQIN